MTHFLLSITVCMAIVGAYIAGHFMGESDGRDAGADAAFNLDASRSAEAFLLATKVRQALRQTRTAEADALVTRFAALKAPSLLACAAQPECAASVGAAMPTRAQLDEAVAAGRPTR